MKVKLRNCGEMLHGKDKSFAWRICNEDDESVGDILILETEGEYLPWYACRDSALPKLEQHDRTKIVNGKPYRQRSLEDAFMDLVDKVCKSLGLRIMLIEPDSERRVTLDKYNDRFFGVLEV